MIVRTLAVALVSALLAACGKQAPDVKYALGPFGCGNLPAGWKLWEPVEGMGHRGVSNSLLLKRSGELRWNGATVTLEQLRSYSGIIATMRPVPELDFHAEPGTSCAIVGSVQRIMTRSCNVPPGAKCIQMSVGQWTPEEQSRQKWRDYLKRFEAEFSHPAK